MTYDNEKPRKTWEKNERCFLSVPARAVGCVLCYGESLMMNLSKADRIQVKVVENHVLPLTTTVGPPPVNGEREREGTIRISARIWHNKKYGAPLWSPSVPLNCKRRMRKTDEVQRPLSELELNWTILGVSAVSEKRREEKKWVVSVVVCVCSVHMYYLIYGPSKKDGGGSWAADVWEGVVRWDLVRPTPSSYYYTTNYYYYCVHSALSPMYYVLCYVCVCVCLKRELNLHVLISNSNCPRPLALNSSTWAVTPNCVLLNKGRTTAQEWCKMLCWVILFVNIYWDVYFM
jgi:hypothetical protein